MIQIKPSLLRNLDKICEEHYLSLHASIKDNLSKLSHRQKVFITSNLYRIVTSKPQELYKINKEYKAYCIAQGKGKIKDANRGLHSVFNYKYFVTTQVSL